MQKQEKQQNFINLLREIKISEEPFFLPHEGHFHTFFFAFCFSFLFSDAWLPRICSAATPCLSYLSWSKRSSLLTRRARIMRKDLLCCRSKKLCTRSQTTRRSPIRHLQPAGAEEFASGYSRWATFWACATAACQFCLWDFWSHGPKIRSIFSSRSALRETRISWNRCHWGRRRTFSQTIL